MVEPSWHSVYHKLTQSSTFHGISNIVVISQKLSLIIVPPYRHSHESGPDTLCRDGFPPKAFGGNDTRVRDDGL